jgi:hypothetical protein
MQILTAKASQTLSPDRRPATSPGAIGEPSGHRRAGAKSAIHANRPKMKSPRRRVVFAYHVPLHVEDGSVLRATVIDETPVIDPSPRSSRADQVTT